MINQGNLDVGDYGGGGDRGGGDYGGGGGYSGGSGGVLTTPTGVPIATTQTATQTVASSPPKTQYDLSPASLAAAAARGNSASDVQSAYQTYLTGVPVGRGGKYAKDAAKKYGVSIEEAARGYLEGSGLWRIVEQTVKTVLDPEDSHDTNGVVTQKEQVGKGDPFERLSDLFEKVFAVREPDATTPVVVVGDTTKSQTAGGGSSAGVILLLLAIGGAAFYWFYWRKRGASGG